MITRRRRWRRIEGRGSCRRHNCATYNMEAAKKYRTGEIMKQKREEQRE